MITAFSSWLWMVEMSVARVRALTHSDMGGHTGHSPVEMSVAHVRGSQRIISEKSTKFPTEKLIIFKKNRRERRFFCVDQFSFTRRNGTVPERRHLLG